MLWRSRNLILVRVVGRDAVPTIAFALGGDGKPVVADVVGGGSADGDAALARGKDGAFVEIPLSSDTHWAAAPGAAFARARMVGRMDDAFALDATGTAPAMGGSGCAASPGCR